MAVLAENRAKLQFTASALRGSTTGIMRAKKFWPAGAAQVRGPHPVSLCETGTDRVASNGSWKFGAF